MKTLKAISITFFLILFTNTISSQKDYDSFELSREIVLNGTSETQEITFEVKSNSRGIIFDIKCELKTNELSIKILDPNGKNIGDFTIENNVKFNQKNKEAINTRKYQETVTGQIDKIAPPIIGKWKIVIEPKQAVFANILINTKQILKKHENTKN